MEAAAATPTKAGSAGKGGSLVELAGEARREAGGEDASENGEGEGREDGEGEGREDMIEREPGRGGVEGARWGPKNSEGQQRRPPQRFLAPAGRRHPHFAHLLS